MRKLFTLLLNLTLLLTFAQIVDAKPKNLLIYYGWLNSYGTWNNETAAQRIAQFDLVVIGDGIQLTSHGDWANTAVIIPRVKALNPNIKIFGYVTINQNFSNFKAKVDSWEANLGVHGIFFDEAGYDYGSVSTNGRAAFNDKVDYVHSTDKLCFINSWKIEHVLGNNSDVSYPDTTWNPHSYDSNLNEDDWYLLESFCVNTQAYTSSNGYESKADWKARGDKCFLTRQNYKINLAASGIIQDGHTSETALFNFHYISALMYEMDAVGTSDDYYGASSAKSKLITRPSIAGMDYKVEQQCNIEVHTADADIYMKYVRFGKLILDFSAGVQTSSITIW